MGEEIPENTGSTSTQEPSHLSGVHVNEQEVSANHSFHATPIHIPDEIASHILSVCF
jgi:hypothetical protein